MATHRRGLRPAQWPVRDLLGAQRDRMGALRDPRLYAAVSGLLACGAAATVVFTASDGAAGPEAGTGPMALPAPNNAAPAPVDPAPADPAPSDPALPDAAPSQPGGGTGSGMVPRAWQLPPDDRPPVVAVPMPSEPDGAERSASVREIADRVAAELVRLQAQPSADGTALLVVPLQRDGNVTALVKRVPRDAPCTATPKRAGGRHRAQEAGGTGDREQRARAHDRKQREQREERDRDEHEEKKRDRDEDRKHDRDERDRDKDRKKHDRDDEREHDRDKDRKHDRDDRKHDRDEHDRDDDREHDRDEHDRDEHDRDDRKHDRDERDRDEDRKHDRKRDRDRDDEAVSTRSTAGGPAMTVLSAPEDDDRDERLGGRTIEPDALLAALDDLEDETFPGWFAA